MIGENKEDIKLNSEINLSDNDKNIISRFSDLLNGESYQKEIENIKFFPHSGTGTSSDAISLSQLIYENKNSRTFEDLNEEDKSSLKEQAYNNKQILIKLDKLNNIIRDIHDKLIICDEINIANIDILKSLEENIGHRLEDKINSNITYNKYDKISNDNFYSQLMKGIKAINMDEINGENDFQEIIFIIKKIINNSSIFLNINNREENKRILIDYKDKSLIDGNINEFELKNELDKIKGQKYEYSMHLNLIDNYNKILSFIEKMEKIIRNKIKSELVIKLNLKEIKENNGNKIKNINCEYILTKPLNDFINKKCYNDNNILINDKLKNFELFLDDIIINEKKYNE